MSRSLTLAALIASSAVMGAATDFQAVSLPTGPWAGIDGNWSTVQFSLGGSTDQTVNVLVGTALSEFWAVGTGGCYENEPRCARQRGGLYTPLASNDWDALGTWELSLQYLGYRGNGEYGRDTVTISSDIPTSHDFVMRDVLMAAINTTEPYLGQFGLAVNQGNFSSVIVKSPLTTAVEDASLISSYSYAYTAGAHYRNVPASVTLGGYDASRRVDHGNEFAISVEDNLPRALVRGIQAEAPSGQSTSDSLDGPVQLSQFNNSFVALFDSSTPFLWFPESTCEQFAKAFNLTYSDDLEVYTITDDQYQEYTQSDSYKFTFTLSDANNNDNLGDPLRTPGVVNITIPLRAFIGTLQYPYNRGAIQYGSPAVPYFSLKKSAADSIYIIGRSFLQESYIITKYDEGYFSIHQARFPDHPADDAHIVAIPGSYNVSSPSSQGLRAGAIAGIVIGAVCAVALLVFAWWYLQRRRKAKQPQLSAAASSSSASDAEKNSAMSVQARSSPFGRMLSKINRRIRPRAATGDPNEKQVSEAPDHQIFELPAPLPPAELDGDNGDDPADDGTLYGHDSPGSVSSYERARLKLDRQLAGPVPEYSPPENGTTVPPEKAIADFEQARQASSLDPESPRNAVSSNGDSLGSNVSPLTPRDNWTIRSEELNRHRDTNSRAADGQSRTGIGSTESSRSQSDQASLPSTPHSVTLPPASAVQRIPIDPSRVVFMGPIPESALSNREDSAAATPQIRINDTPASAPDLDTLGTNFTEEEQERMTQLAAVNATQTANGSGGSSSEPDNGEIEIIHVPQLAEKRYSWEEER